jgi:hypothetical protein
VVGGLGSKIKSKGPKETMNAKHLTSKKQRGIEQVKKYTNTKLQTPNKTK